VTKLYLAYGSNLNQEQMARRCPTAKVVGAAILSNYRLAFCGRYSNAVATILPKKGGHVPVLIWEITQEDEDSLDRYEGFPYLYRKENLKVKLSGKPVKAMVYIMNDTEIHGSPSRSYYGTILAGYKAAGFDVEILREAANTSSGILPADEVKWS
jgi:gamma-glutamylcyclotransferase (GGCT)/AIG2-like uncharacterized protein YtfP